MAGKGSKPRPFSVTQQEFSTRWDNIFNKPKGTPTHVRITNCVTGNHKWYCDMVGKVLPVYEDCGTEWRSKQPGGYWNFIDKRDCEPYED